MNRGPTHYWQYPLLVVLVLFWCELHSVIVISDYPRSEQRTHCDSQSSRTTETCTLCRHATISRGKSVFFSVKICIIPYPSLNCMHRCIAKTFTRFISRCSLQTKSRHCVIQINSQQQRTNIGALFHVARHSD